MSIVVRNAKRILNIWCFEIWNQKDVRPVIARKCAGSCLPAALSPRAAAGKLSVHRLLSGLPAADAVLQAAAGAATDEIHLTHRNPRQHAGPLAGKLGQTDH